MAIARGHCPSCGAPIEFAAGSSVAKVCEFCHSTIFRTDRSLEDLGKVAAIANVPSLIAVGDEGTLGGRPFRVLGRTQLDHGAGPWDEYYVAYDNGASWGYLAYAEGIWYATSLWPEAPAVPAFGELRIENDVSFGTAGTFRVAEVKTGSVVSAEGELSGKVLPGATRRYADLHGENGAFATLDYGDETAPVEVFVGRRFAESDMQVQAVAPRTADKIKTSLIKCPNCGGDIPKLSGERALRVGCPYCGAVSDIAAQNVIAQQDKAMATSPIPIGARGNLAGTEYTCIAYVRRRTDTDGERFAWEELLLFAEGVGFRWLVKDEASWLFVTPVNLAELDLSGMPRAVRYRGQRFGLRNDGLARVDYVLGEVYWRAEVGETTRAADYVLGKSVLSREESPGEVRWSLSEPIPWPVLARAFNAPLGGEAGRFASSGGSSSPNPALVALVIIGIILFLIVSAAMNHGSGIGGTYVSTPVFGGSGTYYGGK